MGVNVSHRIIPWLKLIRFFTILGYYLTFTLLLLPFKYLYDAITGHTVKAILTASSFHNLGSYSDHQPLEVSQSAVNSFPSWGFTLTMVIGALILTLGILFFLRSLAELFHNLIAGLSWSPKNINLLRRLVKSQLLITIGNGVITLANQLPIGWLHQLHFGILGANWDNVLENLFWLVILSMIAGLYQQAVNKINHQLTL